MCTFMTLVLNCIYNVKINRALYTVSYNINYLYIIAYKNKIIIITGTLPVL